MESTNRFIEERSRPQMVEMGSDYEINASRERREGHTRNKLDDSRLDIDRHSAALRSAGQASKVFSTAKKSGRRSPGAQSNKKSTGSPKKTKPSVIEAMRSDQMYMEMANMKGYQIHPKQQSEMLRESKVRQMLSNSATLDPQTQLVLTRASAIQASINNSANMYSSIQSKATQAKLNESVNQIISSQKFENELKESIAEKIAKEISENIKASYQNAANLNSSLPEECSSTQLEEDSPSAQKSGTKKKTSKKQKLAQLSKGTFSSNQKNNCPDATIQVSEYTMQSERQLVGSKANSASKKKRAKTKRQEDGQLMQEDDLQMGATDESSLLDLNRSKSSHQKLIASAVARDKQVSQMALQAALNHEQRKKTKSQSNLRNPHLGPRLIRKKEIIHQIDYQNEELVDQLSSQLNESAQELSEKMKMISINDLYRLTSNRQDAKVVQPLADHEQERASAGRDQVSPGVAPSVTPQVGRYTNQFLSLNNVANQQDSPFGGSQHPLSYASPNHFPNATLERHLKNKSSIIPEATEEYIQYTSNTPERTRERNTIGQEGAINFSPVKESLKATKKSSPTQKREGEAATRGNKKSQRLSRVKKSFSKKLVAKTQSSPLSGRSQGGLTQNRYYRNLNKRYIDAARSSSRGAVNQQSSRNTDREFAKAAAGRNAYDSKPSRNSNKPNLSQLNITEEFEMIESTIRNQQTLQPRDKALVSLAKPKKKREDQATKGKHQDGKQNVYFQRKNSSPSPFRLRGLQQKYSQTETPNKAAKDQKSPGKQPLVKNQYLHPLETPEPKHLEEESYEDLNDRVDEAAAQSEGNAQGIITERRSPKTHQIDLNSDRTESSGQSAELKLNKEPRRSRKDRSRENLLCKNRPMSHNVESLTIPKKPIQVYSNIQEQQEVIFNNNEMLEAYMLATSEGEQVAQIFSNEKASAQDAPASTQGQSHQQRDDDGSEGSSERLQVRKREREHSKELAKMRSANKGSAKKGQERKKLVSNQTSQHQSIAAQKKTTLQHIFGSNKYQASSQLVAALQQSSESKGTTRQQQRTQNTRALRSSFGPSASQTKTASKQTPAKKANQVELTPSKTGTKTTHQSQLKNQYVDSRLIQHRMTGLMKEELGSEQHSSANKSKKRVAKSPWTQVEQANQERKQHGMSDSLLQEPQNQAHPYLEQLSASFDKIYEQERETARMGPITQQLLTNQSKRLVTKTKSELKVIRSELSSVLRGLTVINFRETEAIRKPQKYMMFSASLFRTVFELITKLDRVVHASQRAKKTIKDKVNRDLLDDIGSDHLALDEESDQLDVHMAKRLQRRLLLKAEQDLSALNKLLPLDSHSKLQASKAKPRDAEKEMLEEWNKKLRPYLYQVNTNNITLIQQIQKTMKAMIEFNSGNPSDLGEIEKFSSKLLDFYDGHSLLTQSCLKGSGQSSALFRQLLTIVHLAVMYINKKSHLTMHGMSQRSSQQHSQMMNSMSLESADIQHDTQSQAMSSERSNDVEEELSASAVQKHSVVVNQWLSSFKAEQELQSDQFAQHEGEQAFGEVKYAENSIDIQLHESAQIGISKQNTAEARTPACMQVSDQKCNKSEKNVDLDSKRVGPLDKLIQMRAKSKQVFEYDNRSEQLSESPCQDSLGFSIKLIKVELESRDSGNLSITGKGSVRASAKSTYNNNNVAMNQEQAEEGRKLNTSELFGKASEESVYPVEYALDQPGSGQAVKEGMRSIFNLREDELFELMPTVEKKVDSPMREEQQAISVVEQIHESQSSKMATLNPTAVVDDFQTSGRASPQTGYQQTEQVTIVDDFNSFEGENNTAFNTIDEAANEKEEKQSHEEKSVRAPTIIVQDPILEEDQEQEPAEQEAVMASIQTEDAVPEPKDSLPQPITTEAHHLPYQSLDSLQQPASSAQKQHSRVDSKVISEAPEEVAEAHSPEDVSSIIQRLQQNIDAIQVPAPIPPHKRRTSQNPYLSKEVSKPETSSVEASAQQAKDTTPERIESTPHAITDSRKKQRSAKKKSQQNSISEKLPIQYGLYNPDAGIEVYRVDPDFDEEEDFFRIKPVKIVQRASASALKTAGRRSPLTGVAGSSAKNSSSRRSKASRQTNESSKQSSNLQNQLNITRQQLNSNTVVRSRARPQRSNTKPHPEQQSTFGQMRPLQTVGPGQTATLGSGQKMMNNTQHHLTNVEVTPFGEQTDQSQISLLSDAFQKVGDTANPYSSNQRRDNTCSNDSRSNNYMPPQLRKSIEERRRMRSQESQKITQ